MANFKVGDRVRLIAMTESDLKLGSVGTVRYASMSSCCVEWDNWHNGHDGNSDGLNIPNNAGWYVSPKSLELVTTYPIITIQTDGKTTTATLREGHNVINTAKAICCEEDEFNYLTGAKLALERVMGEEEKREEKKFEIGMRVKDTNYSFDWGYATHIRENGNGVFITPLEVMGDFLKNGAKEHCNCFMIDENYSTILDEF